MTHSSTVPYIYLMAPHGHNAVVLILHAGGTFDPPTLVTIVYLPVNLVVE